MTEYTTTEPSGLRIEQRDADGSLLSVVHVPQSVEAEGGAAVATYVQQQLASPPPQ